MAIMAVKTINNKNFLCQEIEMDCKNGSTIKKAMSTGTLPSKEQIKPKNKNKIASLPFWAINEKVNKPKANMVAVSNHILALIDVTDIIVFIIKSTLKSKVHV